jgi:hypothetical protein
VRTWPDRSSCMLHTPWPWIQRGGRPGAPAKLRHATTATWRIAGRSESTDHYCSDGAAAWRSLGSCAEQCERGTPMTHTAQARGGERSFRLPFARHGWPLVMGCDWPRLTDDERCVFVRVRRWDDSAPMPPLSSHAHEKKHCCPDLYLQLELIPCCASSLAWIGDAKYSSLLGRGGKEIDRTSRCLTRKDGTASLSQSHSNGRINCIFFNSCVQSNLMYCKYLISARLVNTGWHVGLPSHALLTSDLRSYVDDLTAWDGMQKGGDSAASFICDRRRDEMRSTWSKAIEIPNRPWPRRSR